MNMTTTPKNQDILPWYRQFWPWFLFALPGSVVVAGIATVFLAFNTPLSLVHDDYYKQGLGINKVLEAQKNASVLGVSAEITFTGTRIRADLNNPLTETLKMTLIHPTSSEQDHSISLNKIGALRFEGTIPASILEEDSAVYKIRLLGTSNEVDWVLNSNLNHNLNLASIKPVSIKPVSIKPVSIKTDSE